VFTNFVQSSDVARTFYADQSETIVFSILVVEIEILVKHRNFDRKLKFLFEISKFRSKIGILIDDWNFYQESKFWSYIEFFSQKSNFLSKNFGQISKFLLKIKVLIKNQNFYQEIEILVKFFVKNQISKVHEFCTNFRTSFYADQSETLIFRHLKSPLKNLNILYRMFRQKT